MVTNFEEITKELSQEDYQLLQQLIRCFEAHDKNNPIKAPKIVLGINNANPFLKRKFTEVKLRKLVNFIRSKGMIGLIATSDGYYSTKDIAEIKLQIKSLEERASAILNSSIGLEYLIQRLEKQKNENV